MRRKSPTRWSIAIALVIILALASVSGSATAPGGVGYNLTFVAGVDPAMAPAIQGFTAQDDAPWWELSAMDADRDGIFDVLDTLVDSGSMETVDVLVDMDHGPTDADALELATTVGSRAWGIFPTLDIVGLSAVPAAFIPKLLDVPGVVMVEPSIDAVPFQDVATRALRARESIEYSPYTAWELGVTGKGINLCIMDTGVDDAHPGLMGKFAAGVDFTKPERPRLYPRDGTYNPDDQGGHGTTCAGIATGTGQPGDEYMGAAPDAQLVDLRIGTRFGFSPGEGPNNFYDAALQAIDWAASHPDTAWSDGSSGIQVLSLSWGIPYDGPSDGSDAYSRGLDQAVRAGIVCAIAAGNEGPDNLGITGMSASSESIIVGALDDLNTITRVDDVVASYSTRGPRHDDNDDYPYDELKPDVTAPGTNINGVVYENRGDGSGGGYGGRGSGTSYATPYVAGVSALLLEANPDLDPIIVREILRTTAERRGDPEYPTLDPFWNGDFGWGMVDAYNATLVAMELDNLRDIDVELQAFITNITGGTSKRPMLEVEGISWARVGTVDHVEWRIDSGDWHPEGLEIANFSFDLDPSVIGEGSHVLEVKAVGADGLNSVWRPVTFEVTEEAVDAAYTTSVGSAAWCVAAAAVVIIAGLFVWKRRPDLIDRGLRIIRIER
jgi:subtilisin family serine protease